MRRILVCGVTAVALGVTAVSLHGHQTVVSKYTYSKDVLPIVRARCGQCHGAGGRAPMLLAYESARAFSFGLQRVLLSGITSPSIADGIAPRIEHQSLSLIEFDTLMTWSAGGTPEDGVKPHKSHQGEHGGLFIEAPGDTVHLEAVFQEQRRFRLYASDPSGAPLPAERVRSIAARVIASGVETALTTSSDRPYLEARIATQKLPVTFTLIVKTSAAVEEQRVNLTFVDLGIEPPESTVPPTIIPRTADGFLAALQAQTKEAEKMSAASGYGQLFIPAGHLRDLLLAMQPHPSLDRVMRAAWLVHLSGDDGSPLQARTAVTELRKSVDQLSGYFK